MRYTDDELRILRRFIRSYILGIIKPIKPYHIIDYANRNKVPNITPFIDSLPDFILEKVHNVLVSKPEIIDEWIKPKYIIRKIGEVRHDLFECIKDPKNRRWLERFINYARSVLKKI